MLNSYQHVKTLLDDDLEVCKFTTNIESIRKIIASLKSKENYVIYSEECDCGLVSRKHFCYVKDWAVS